MATPYTRLINPYQNLQSTAEKKVEVVDLPKNNATVEVIGQTTKNPVVAPTPQQKTAAATTIPKTGEVTNISKQISALNTSGLNEAYTRMQKGTANEIDKANVKYAQSRGWSPTTPAPSSGTLNAPGATAVPTVSTPSATTPSATTPAAPTTSPMYTPAEPEEIKTLTSKLADIQSKIAAKQTAIEQGDIDLTGGELALEGQGRGIPLTLIRGQQGKLELQRQIAKQTEQTELAGLQREEAGLISQLKTAGETYKAEKEQYTPIAVGNKIIQYNPTTGKYETLYEAPSTERATVSAGETVIDPTTGKVIYQAPAGQLTESQKLDVQKKQLEINKLQQDIENSTSDIDRAIKEADLAKKIKELSGEEDSEQTEYQIERADRVITQVDEALKNVNNLTTGYGALLDFWPESQALNFSKQIEAIKANIGFNELQAMRSASPTGGALGQVAVQELNFLQSVLGSLDAKQSPEQVTANLRSIKTHFENWKNAVEQSNNTQNEGEFSW